MLILIYVEGDCISLNILSSDKNILSTQQIHHEVPDIMYKVLKDLAHFIFCVYTFTSIEVAIEFAEM